VGAPISILLGAVIIAAAIAFSFRGEVAVVGGEPPLSYRLDRWTGAIALCVPQKGALKLDCEPK